MQSVNLKGNVINFNRIVAYGCSFTVGQETADHELFAAYGDGEKIDKFKKECNGNLLQFIDAMRNYGADKLYLPGTDIYSWEKHEALEKQKSWANILGHLLNVPVWNQATKGASVDQNFALLEQDISSGKVTKDDLVTVGLTSFDRYYVPDTGRTKLLWYANHWQSEEYHRIFLDNIANMMHIMWTYYTSIISLIELSKLHSINLLLAPAYYSITDIIDRKRYPVDEYTDVEFVATLFKSIYESPCYLEVDSLDKMSRDIPGKHYGFGHPSAECQRDFALSIYREIKV